MTILGRGQITYYVKEESIIAEYNNQYISYNVYALQNRKRFKDFKQALVDSHKDEYGTIAELISLSNRFALNGMVGSKPTVTEFDNYA